MAKEDKKNNTDEIFKPCRECGIRHYGRCSQCPHDGDVAKYGSYENSPCADCGAPSDSRKIGHGKVLRIDEELFGGQYIQQDPVESSDEYNLLLDLLRGFASLSPEEHAVFVGVRYQQKTYETIAEELTPIFSRTFSKTTVMNCLRSAEDKMRLAVGSESLVHGKVSKK